MNTEFITRVVTEDATVRVEWDDDGSIWDLSVWYSGVDVTGLLLPSLISELETLAYHYRADDLRERDDERAVERAHAHSNMYWAIRNGGR